MKGKERTFSAHDSHFSFSPIKVKGIKNSVKCRKMMESGERKKRGKCFLAFQTLPAGSKELNRLFCGTEKPNNNLMGPPDSIIMRR